MNKSALKDGRNGEEEEYEDIRKNKENMDSGPDWGSGSFLYAFVRTGRREQCRSFPYN